MYVCMVVNWSSLREKKKVTSVSKILQTNGIIPSSWLWKVRMLDIESQNYPGLKHILNNHLVTHLMYDKMSSSNCQVIPSSYVNWADHWLQPAPVGTQSKEWHMVNNALGNCERVSRQRTFSLRCILFPGLFWDVILCLLRLTFTFSSQDMFILVGRQNIGVRTQSGQCALNLDMPFCLLLCFPRYNV